MEAVLKLSQRSILGNHVNSRVGIVGVAQPTEAQQRPAPVSARKPNILVIMGDDIGWFNVSATILALWAIELPTSTASPKKELLASVGGRSSEARIICDCNMTIDHRRFGA